MQHVLKQYAGQLTCDAVCSWTIMEAEAYLQYTDSIARKRSKKEWTVDLSWLIPLGVQVPEVSTVSAQI